VFVHYFTEAGVTFDQAVEGIGRLVAEMSTWAGSAYRNGEALAGRLGGMSGLASLVLFDLGSPRPTPAGLTYSVRWRATGASSLFPRLEAELEIADMGDSVLVTLRGNYDPPLGTVGRLVDRAILGRVADATVKSWVDRLAGELTVSDRDGDLDSRAQTRLGNERDMPVQA
jgi:hypothetical protein